MKPEFEQDMEKIQRVTAHVVANSPAGRNLALIGGFRYRFLDAHVSAWKGESNESC
ncbi:MAG: hypothetical protein HQ559_18575 [Lentisphaerae bacterium]|nr:hypothetical protein [Lentisphaerota bacterium]